MCIIITTQNGHIPHEHLKNAILANPDGIGYIFKRQRDKRMIIRKFMNEEGFFDRWKKDEHDRNGRPVIFHARIGTSGITDRLNCHPFRVGTLRLWAAHNGTFPDYTPAIGERENDTRIFIKEMLGDLPANWPENPNIWLLLEKYIGTSKLAFMDSAGTILILNEHLGKKKKGRWYSNESYKMPTQRTPYNAGSAWTGNRRNQWGYRQTIPPVSAANKRTQPRTPAQMGFDAEDIWPDLHDRSDAYDESLADKSRENKLIPRRSIPRARVIAARDR